jgi:hypothetical protein
MALSSHNSVARGRARKSALTFLRVPLFGNTMIGSGVDVSRFWEWNVSGGAGHQCTACENPACLNGPGRHAYCLATNRSFGSIVGIEWEDDETAVAWDGSTAIQTIAALPKDAESCRIALGTWFEFGNSGRFYCRVRARDGGRTCTSSVDCEGICVVPSDNLQSHGPSVCSNWLPLFGCNTQVEGSETGTVCRE